MCISLDEARLAPLLDAAAERQAIRDWQTARSGRAGETLLRSHARLVHALVRRWRRRGSDRDDLVAAGMLGILTAADRFELNRGLRFSTYARWWIQTLIGAEVARQGSLLTLPARKYHDLIRGALDEAEAQEIRAALDGVLPLDAPLGGEGRSLGDTLASDAPNPEEALAAAGELGALRRALDAAIADLPSPAREVVRLRAGAEPPDHGEIAARLKLSVEKVRALERSAHLRLRRSLMLRGVTPAACR